ncbi:lantibiotic dehydratase [Curtobacterium sp. HSID17257]|uniref:lantibiotic dehydratase n=1 Tax=Curtobacterium sp. HSID17257 TaxID=2419510 RepID=UPI001386EB94|nr:lantibiotic dehydratase [Curtobacterium sp. HSID17257]
MQHPVVERRSGLNVDVLDGSRDDALLLAIDACLDAETALERRRRAASDALFAEIGSTSGRLRAALVGLRRSIHNGRTPSPRECSDEVVGKLPPELRKMIQALATQDRDPLANGEEIVQVAFGRSLQWLESVVRSPLLQRALAQASPHLLEHLQEKHCSQWGRRQRVSAVRYVTRAATKTSPYSTFTFTGLVDTDESAKAEADAPPISLLELDQYVFAQIVQATGLQPDFRGARRVRPNPSIERDAEYLLFLGPPPNEALAKLRETPQVRRVIDAVADGRSSVDELVQTLAGDAPGSTDAVEQFLDRLTEIGLLECRLPLDEQDPDVLDQLAAFVRSRRPRSSLAITLTELARTVSASSDLLDVAAHGRRIDKICGCVAAVADELELPWASEGALRKVAFHENALLGRTSSWPAALEDSSMSAALQDVVSWVTVHDRMLPIRVAAYEYSRIRFPGRGTLSFLELYRAVQEDLAADPETIDPLLREYLSFLRLSRPAPIDSLVSSRDTRLRRLHALRTASRTLFSSASQQGRPVQRRALNELRATYPDWVRPLSSATFYAQTFSERTETGLVVNVIGAGNGRGRSRWARLVGLANGRPPLPLQTDGTADRRVLEVSGVFGAAGNLRSPAADLVLDYPHTGSWDDGDARRLTLTDLRVEFDETTELLALRSDAGLGLLPVHTGLMADPLLPPSARFLLAVFGESNAAHPAFPLINAVPTAAPPTNGTALGRVSYERVVIERAKWVFARRDVPISRSDLSTLSGLTSVERWRRDTGVPERVYVRLVDETSDWRQQAFGKARKPMFVDLRAQLTLEAFADQLHGHHGLVVFEEALPNPAAGLPGTAHTEFVVEIRSGEPCRS